MIRNLSMKTSYHLVAAEGVKMCQTLHHLASLLPAVVRPFIWTGRVVNPSKIHGVAPSVRQGWRKASGNDIEVRTALQLPRNSRNPFPIPLDNPIYKNRRRARWDLLVICPSRVLRTRFNAATVAAVAFTAHQTRSGAAMPVPVFPFRSPLTQKSCLLTCDSALAGSWEIGSITLSCQGWI